ncbi:hypothetical protein BDN72DRAFT_466059 [Pluteus cervinus]|uniref:Uncharacterized protein n=1 Tax=Pluteus cervinus TaxID=181527 RepID=A0ACD3A6K3_9AGAR|nr:hypothetical protein BDN72DRAFT_466059 [Pluteus cervinus]
MYNLSNSCSSRTLGFSMRGKKRKASRKATAATTPAPKATIISLPNELLLWIFQDLDSQILFDLGISCRRLNSVALPSFIQRSSPGVLNGFLDIPVCHDHWFPRMYSAIHSAFCLQHLSRLSVTLIRVLPEALKQLTALSDIARSKVSFRCLSLHITPVLSSDLSGEELERGCQTFTLLLQKFLNCVVEKGCTEIRVVGTLGLNYSFAMENYRLSSQLKQVAPSSPTPRRSSRVRERAGYPSQGGDSENSTFVDTNPGITYPSPATLTSITLDGMALFDKTWQNWTLHLLNTAPLTYLTIDSSESTFEMDRNWDELLLNFHLPSLTFFSINGTIPSSKNLGLFLEGHSSALENLSIHIHKDPSQDRSPLDLYGDSSSIACLLAPFNFPRLSHLRLGAADADWFIQGVLNASPFEGPRPYLPNLRLVNLSISLYSSKHSLIKAFDALSGLVSPVVQSNKTPDHGHGASTSQTGGEVQKDNPYWTWGSSWDSEPLWFPKLEVTLGKPYSDSSLKDYLTQPSTPTSSPSPPSALVCIQTLSFESRDFDNNPLTDDDVVYALPPFLASFSRLKTLLIGGMKLSEVRTLSTREYWRRVKDLCPNLEKCIFESGIEMSMEELVRKDQEGRCLWTVEDVMNRRDKDLAKWRAW